MRRLVLIGIALAAVLGPSADAVPVRRVAVGHGLSVVLPAGWHVDRARLSTCADPVQRLAVRTHGALVLLQETFEQGSFPARPAQFPLGPVGRLGGCCDMPDGRGSEVMFRDHWRRFYAFVYATKPEQRRGALELLDSLRVSPEAVAGA